MEPRTDPGCGASYSSTDSPSHWLRDAIMETGDDTDSSMFKTTSGSGDLAKMLNNLKDELNQNLKEEFSQNLKENANSLE